MKLTVYVDDAQHPFGRMLMCHMMADSLEELHAMARTIGLKTAWFQPGRHPHYDVCSSKRAVAISEGAIPITQREMVRHFRFKEIAERQSHMVPDL